MKSAQIAPAPSGKTAALDLAERAGGLLPREVYDEIYSVAESVTGTTFVEVGTAHGAATIAMALGGQAAGSRPMVLTIDRLGGTFSSRSKFGAISENEKVVRENFASAGVTDCVELFVGTSDDFVSAGKTPKEINLLMLDADGRIDRDLLYFYDRMPIGSPIIIDDAQSLVALGCNYEDDFYVDLKHQTTWLLMEAFRAAGYLELDKMVCGTAFCRKTKSSLDHEQFRLISLGAYRELVFTKIKGNHWDELLEWHQNRDKVRQSLRLRSMMPEFLFQLRRLILSPFRAGEK